tara:strand:+ start:206 stop:400 length:195 start_codon:yes stop_codon:yes gene_type:complete
MKVFITEFTYKDKNYEGPTVVASSFDEAEAKAEMYGCVVVGILEMVIDQDELNIDEMQWNRVLH